MYKTGSSVGRSQRHDRSTHALPLTKKAQQAERARTLFFDEAEAGAVAAEELHTTDTGSRASAPPCEAECLWLRRVNAACWERVERGCRQ